MATTGFNEIQVTCELVKEGKDVLQYQQTTNPPMLKGIYVDRTAAYYLFGDTPPKTLRFTIDNGE